MHFSLYICNTNHAEQMRCKLLFLILFASLTAFAQEQSQFVEFTQQSDNWLLNAVGQINVYIDSSDQPGVRRATETVMSDLKSVCQAEVRLTPSAEDAQVVVGTLGYCKAIDKLLGKQQKNSIKGHREQFLITSVGHQLVIAGSDRRGTIYGLYELSRQAGVSPWAWWADVAVQQHDSLFVKNGEYSAGEPLVRWRGIFLNDEGPCLMQWVKNTYGTDYGDHRFYERVFELILRLRGNFLWPAMWAWAFYADDPENSKLADEMGIIIGTSHHEPMARNHQEYARNRRQWGAWNYQTNQENLDRFFREGIERMKGTEDIVTIGMRGDGDEAMSEEADTRLLERVVENQRRIIKEVTGKPAKETPQVWALYKEVLDYYDKGMRVPDDVTILLCDDNWGNVRRVPTTEERKHPGGWGLYYHVDYVGAPRNTKWINVTQSQGMWEQLRLAADFGLDRLWVLNVGDLKPMEYQIQLFMDMAWNPNQFIGQDLVSCHTQPFCETLVGAEKAAEAARLLDLSARYNSRVTAEMLDARTYNLKTGEWDRVCGDFARLEADALQLYRELEPEQQTAYHELILFPIQAMANLYEMYRAVAMNYALAAIGDPEANVWAERAQQRFRRDSLLCDEYNNHIANGKWRGMMIQKHIGYTSWNDNFPADHLPPLKIVEAGTNPSNTFFDELHRGYLAIDAQHFASSKTSEGTQWTVYPGMGRTGSAVALTPYTKETGDARLSYRFELPEEVSQVRVHIIVKSTLDFLNRGGHEYEVSIDNGKTERVNFNSQLNEAPQNIYRVFYPTIARRVVENTVTFPVEGGGTHVLDLRPLTPGIVFEKMVIDYGGYQPQYLFGEESGRK